MDPNLKEYLDKHRINYTIHKHERVFTVEESRNIKEFIPGLATKNLFLKSGNQFYLLLMPAESRLNTKNLRNILKSKEIKFGSERELKENLNITPGSVSLFNMIYSKSVILLIDKRVWDAEITGFHPNDNSATLEINHLNLEKFIKTLNCKSEILELI